MDPCFREDNSGSDWIIRLEFYKQDLINKNITMEEIYHRINLYYGDSIKCVYSDDNSNKLIFRIRIIKKKKGDFDKINDINYIKSIVNNILNKVISLKIFK